MSLVGPRMISPPEWAKFGNWKHNLLTVKPGITDLWQVGGRSELSYEDRVRLVGYGLHPQLYRLARHAHPV